jgi:PAS domain S-box-containing protein
LEASDILKKDIRVQKILDLLLKYTLGDYSTRETVSQKGDELDAIIIGLNTLGEEAEASGKIVRDFESRVEAIMSVLLKYTLFDFSEKIEVGAVGDELDAIAIGLNTMAEELETARSSESKHLKRITESEEMFRILVEQVKDYAIIMVDLDGRISTWNTGAENIKGYTREEIIGKPISLFYTEEENKRNESKNNLKAAKEKGRYECEGWRVKKDGSLFWADVIYTALYDENGNLKGYSKVTRDITEKKKADDRIKNTNYFLDTVLNNIPNMVFVKDAKELRFVRFNKAGESLLGYDRKDLIGKNDYDLFPKEQADFFTAKDRQALNRTEVTEIEEELIETATGPKWLHTKKIPIIGADGKPEYLLGISEDITARKKNEDKIRILNTELQNSITQLESTNNELEAFTYSVSHDLRAPLRAIHGYTAILEKEFSEKLDDEAKKMMVSVKSNAIKMGQLIDDLLALSRSGKKTLVKKETDMTDLVHKCIDELRRSVNFSKAKLIVEPLESITVDPSLMFQVFFNLISNAVKYSSLNEKPVIEICSVKNDDEIIYSIKDNGTGFDMRYYNKLFGVFQRLHDASEFEGTGVGLALVKRIVTKHNGRVWAEAEVNKGATFYIALKINQ